MKCSVVLALAVLVAGAHSSFLLGDALGLSSLGGLTGSGLGDILGINNDLNGIVKDVYILLSQLLSGDLGGAIGGLTDNLEISNLLGDINSILGTIDVDGELSETLVSKLLQLVENLLKKLLGENILDVGKLTGILEGLPITGDITAYVTSLTQITADVSVDGSLSGSLDITSTLNGLVSNLLKSVNDILTGSNMGSLTGSGLGNVLGLSEELNGLLKDVTSAVNQLASGDVSGAVSTILGEIDSLLSTANVDSSGHLSDSVVEKLLKLVQDLLNKLLGDNLLDLGSITGILDQLPITGGLTDLVNSLTQQAPSSSGGDDNILNNLLQQINNVVSGPALGGLADIGELNGLVKDVSSALNRLISGDVAGFINAVLGQVLPSVDDLVDPLDGRNGLLSFANGIPKGITDLSFKSVPGMPTGDLSKLFGAGSGTLKHSIVFAIDAAASAGFDNFNNQIHAVLAAAEKILANADGGHRVYLVINGASQALVDLSFGIEYTKYQLATIGFNPHKLTPAQALSSALEFVARKASVLKADGRHVRLVTFINDFAVGSVMSDPLALCKAMSRALILKDASIEIEVVQMTGGVVGALSLDSVLAVVASPTTAAGMSAVYRIGDSSGLLASIGNIVRCLLGALNVSLERLSGSILVHVSDAVGKSFTLKIPELLRK